MVVFTSDDAERFDDSRRAEILFARLSVTVWCVNIFARTSRFLRMTSCASFLKVSSCLVAYSSVSSSRSLLSALRITFPLAKSSSSLVKISEKSARPGMTSDFVLLLRFCAAIRKTCWISDSRNARF